MPSRQESRAADKIVIRARELVPRLEIRDDSMFFFNDECDFRDDDQYDFFTLATQIERHRPAAPPSKPHGESLLRGDALAAVNSPKKRGG